MVKSMVGAAVGVLGLLVAEDSVAGALDSRDEGFSCVAAATLALLSASLSAVFEVVCSERGKMIKYIFNDQTQFQKYS